MSTAEDKCLICDKSSLKPAYKFPGLQTCTVCGFITAFTDISDEELAKLYGEDYFHGQEYNDYVRDKDAIQRNFTKRLNILDRFRNDSHNTLFEIGCAYGFFLDLAKHHFKKVSGADISADAVKYAVNTLGVHARTSNYLDMSIDPYDVCCMWDTIEHLREPDKFIAKISTEISQGGLLAITTGDAGSLNARVRGKKWRQIHPPTHLHYFSVPTLSKLLQREGFQIVHVSHPGNLISVDTALYIILVIQRKREKLYEFIKRLLGKLVNLYLPVNLGDIMYVIARKT